LFQEIVISPVPGRHVEVEKPLCFTNHNISVFSTQAHGHPHHNLRHTPKQRVSHQYTHTHTHTHTQRHTHTHRETHTHTHTQRHTHTHAHTHTHTLCLLWPWCVYSMWVFSSMTHTNTHTHTPPHTHTHPLSLS